MKAQATPPAPTNDVIVGDESAITTPVCTRCGTRPAHPEAFGLCEPCDDYVFDFMGLADDDDLDDEAARPVADA